MKIENFSNLTQGEDLELLVEENNTEKLVKIAYKLRLKHKGNKIKFKF